MFSTLEKREQNGETLHLIQELKLYELFHSQLGSCNVEGDEEAGLEHKSLFLLKNMKKESTK